MRIGNELKGLVRNVDDLGRIVVPMEVRKALHIGDKTPMELYLTDEGILLKISYTEDVCISAVGSMLNQIHEDEDIFGGKSEDVIEQLEFISEILKGNDRD